jgi:hypothetical protein
MIRFLPTAPAAVAAVLCGVVAARLGSATAASARTLSAGCPDASGPAYAVAGRSTHLYVVEVRGGVSCAFAAACVGKLAAQSRLGPLHGPAGWSCVAASRTTSLTRADLTAGLKG